MSSFVQTCEAHELDLTPLAVETLQVNLTRLCNQACAHCHVGSSPSRIETMDRQTVDACLEILAAHDEIATLDLTGGAPELHPDFEYFVCRARELGKHVIVRHNLTVTLDPHPLTSEPMLHLPKFFARNGVVVVASLPCYQRENTDRQRGDGVFDKSIRSLRLLNAEGYGRPESGLPLQLVHNPTGNHLPGLQSALERDYHEALLAEYGVTFSNLWVMANMPVDRFDRHLRLEEAAEGYARELADAYSPAAALRVMCRVQVSVGWDGTLYDCDFNRALGLAIGDDEPMSVNDFDVDRLRRRAIRFAGHCFGCTAGAGSSCCGATA